jgi:hypothetical protein
VWNRKVETIIKIQFDYTCYKQRICNDKKEADVLLVCCHIFKSDQTGTLGENDLFSLTQIDNSNWSML